MGSCLSCPEKESIPDNHQSKFKVINVDDDGNELGSGVMELTETELVLHTHRRDNVCWPYLCLRRYGYDSNLFSFESGRRCQTGQGIFAFKCSRAEEIFNMLQEVMHSHSISVVEEAVLEPGQQGTLTPAALGYAVPNGLSRLPSVGDAPSHPSTRHPSVASTRLPSVGEESTHPLLEEVHTYVNTSGLLEEQSSPLTVTTPIESPSSPCCPTPPPPPRARPDGAELMVPPEAVGPPDKTEPSLHPEGVEPQVLLEPQGVRFVLGPTPVQRQLMEKERQQKEAEPQETNGHTEAPSPPDAEPHPLHSNGSASSVAPPRRHRPPPLTPDLQNVNNSAQRRTALLDYENLPALPPVWESRKPSAEEQYGADLRTPSLNGHAHYHGSHAHPLSAALEPLHNYVNTENVTAPLSAHRPDTARRRSDAPTVFNFDFRRLPGGNAEPPKMLNYIEVEMDGGTGNKGTSDGSNPHTPRTPSSPPPPATPTRRTELYALIDIERTAAMSNLQKARPRDDGTSRKTRHNSTELPTKSAA
ncbi:fibroblast growth factor receptor substrate 2-like [Gouania willdenowi]|uniref:IRS-type PTB domain-containing protein n=1 Tax=Gouania willdenowi TaxID=441366 RepID=A0A8C5E3L8_GOUWI|nr:fibroblast growth factor receptor substrate 2 [Gouania willdenowi]XP_028305990.1 fibroblast growth factor receptor substrate 2 [Gouania willdenowi]